jgi:hypothetical protein
LTYPTAQWNQAKSASAAIGNKVQSGAKSIAFILAFTPKGGGAVHIDLSNSTVEPGEERISSNPTAFILAFTVEPGAKSIAFILAFTPKGGGAVHIDLSDNTGETEVIGNKVKSGAKSVAFILAFTPKGGGAVHIDLSDNTEATEENRVNRYQRRVGRQGNSIFTRVHT